jgi:hypothetical protein
MPKVRKKKMLSLNSDEQRRLISDCDAPVKKAIILLLADSGLRRAFRDCHLMPVDGMHGCRHLSFGTKRDKSGSGTILANLIYIQAACSRGFDLGRIHRSALPLDAASLGDCCLIT